MIAGALLNEFANVPILETTQKAVFVATKTRDETASVTKVLQ